MPGVSDQTAHLEHLIARLQQGDMAARPELLNAAGERLMRLTRRMFHHEHRLKKLEETGDVFQNASLRLYMALAEVKPATVRDFFRLAAFHIRRELIDLARHYNGPKGLGTHETRLPPASGDTAASHTRSPPLGGARFTVHAGSLSPPLRRSSDYGLRSCRGRRPRLRRQICPLNTIQPTQLWIQSRSRPSQSKIARSLPRAQRPKHPFRLGQPQNLLPTQPQSKVLIATRKVSSRSR
jgi:hypothetical protein